MKSWNRPLSEARDRGEGTRSQRGDISALALLAHLRARRSFYVNKSPMLWLVARGPLAGPPILKIVKVVMAGRY